MSVYIKGMEMPESCDECVFMETQDSGFGNDYICGISKQDVDGVCDCPLIEVPPHGRLIDADALIEDLERQCKEVFRIDAVSPDDYWITRNEAYNEALWKSWVESFGEYLKTRPTIVEAEE